MRQPTTICVFFLFLFLTGPHGFVHGQGKLGKVRDAVRQDTPKNDAPKHKPTKKNRAKNRDRHRSGLGLRFALFLADSLTSVGEAVHIVDYSSIPGNTLPSHSASPTPIEATLPVPPPHTVSDSSPALDFNPAPILPPAWSVRLSLQGGTDFDDLTLGNFGLLFQNPGGRGLDSSVTVFGESGIDFRDHLTLVDFNRVYELLASHLFRLRAGIGVNWLIDSLGSEAGFNLTTGFDWNLAPKWWLTGEVDLGTIGATDLTHAQISLGRSLGQSTSWTTGYSHHDIGGVTIGSAFTGLQFRF